VLDANDQPVGDRFTSDSTGRAICPVELDMGGSYTLQEISSPVPNVQPKNMPFTMDKSNLQLTVLNEVSQPNTPYGTI